MILLLPILSRAADEAPVATGTYAVAQACQDCVMALGVDEQTAPIVAVVVAVALRPAIDAFWRAIMDRITSWRSKPAEPSKE